MIEKLFIDRRILVNGKQSHIRLDNFVELGLIPTGGLPCQLIIKKHPDYWRYDWGYLDEIVTINNGITYDSSVCPNTIKLGGALTEDTSITGGNAFDFSLIDIDSLFIDINQPLSGNGIGALLQRINTSSEAEWTQYNFPLADGSTGEILVTDGNGQLNWTSVNSYLTVNNGLTLTGSLLQLGGNLVQNTNINGLNTHSLTLQDLSLYQNGQFLTLGASNQFVLSTPNVTAFGGSIGSLLQTINAQGAAEFTSYKFPTVVASNPRDILVAQTTNVIDWEPQRETVVLHIADGNIELSTVAGTPALSRTFGTGLQFIGWKLESITFSTSSVGGAVIPLEFTIDIDGSIIGPSFFSGGVQTFQLNSPVLTANSYFTLNTSANAGSGTDMFGLAITITFISS
jgi:hypothetical protein